MIKQVSHISYLTNSLKKVENFYIKKLNLKIVHVFRNKINEIYGYFISSNSNTFLEFFLSKKKLLVKNMNYQHICFEVKNIYLFRNKMLKKGLKLTKIKRGRTDKILQCFVKDLEGNVIEFHQRDKMSKF